MTTPTPEIELDELLRELASSRGISGRARLLARHWRQLRGLSDEQRQRVALALGTEAAGRQLERLFLRDGVLSEDERAVTEALDRLGEADPAELRELVESLREGNRREAGRRLLTAVQAALEEEPAGPAAAPPLDAELQKSGTEPPAVDAEPPRPEAEPPPLDAEPPPLDAEPPRPEAGPPSPSTPSPAVEAEPPRPEAHLADPEDSLKPEPESRPPEPDALAPDPSDRLIPGEPPEPRAARSPVPDRPTDQRPGPALPAVERLRRLRRLHRDPDHVEALGPEGRAALRARMGDGWAARRCVSAMIRSDRLSGLDEALALIESLSSPAAVTWCLADLIAAGGLGEPAIRRVLAAAPSAAARRRLERRAARRSDRGPRPMRA